MIKIFYFMVSQSLRDKLIDGFFLKVLFSEKFEKYVYNKDLSFYKRTESFLPRRNLDMACDKWLKSDMSQFETGEEYGLLSKLIKKPSTVTLYETAEDKSFYIPRF